jgi:hypothetical protein
MADKAWKAFERRIAKWWPGAKRRGAYTGSGRRGRSDLICPGWSIECKLWRNFNFLDLRKAALQAERNREESDDIPVAVCKRLRERDKDSLVIMRLETFAEYFINERVPFDDESDKKD